MSGQNKDTGIDMHISTKTAITAIVVILSTIGAGNFGLNWVMMPEANGECPEMVTVTAEIKDLGESLSYNEQAFEIHEEQARSIKSNVSANRVNITLQRGELSDLKALVHKNAEQINKLIGRVDALLNKSWE